MEKKKYKGDEDEYYVYEYEISDEDYEYVYEEVENEQSDGSIYEYYYTYEEIDENSNKEGKNRKTKKNSEINKQKEKLLTDISSVLCGLSIVIEKKVEEIGLQKSQESDYKEEFKFETISPVKRQENINIDDELSEITSLNESIKDKRNHKNDESEFGYSNESEEYNEIKCYSTVPHIFSSHYKNNNEVTLNEINDKIGSNDFIEKKITKGNKQKIPRGYVTIINDSKITLTSTGHHQKRENKLKKEDQYFNNDLIDKKQKEVIVAAYETNISPEKQSKYKKTTPMISLSSIEDNKPKKKNENDDYNSDSNNSLDTNKLKQDSKNNLNNKINKISKVVNEKQGKDVIKIETKSDQQQNPSKELNNQSRTIEIPENVLALISNFIASQTKKGPEEYSNNEISITEKLNVIDKQEDIKHNSYDEKNTNENNDLLIMKDAVIQTESINESNINNSKKVGGNSKQTAKKNFITENIKNVKNPIKTTPDKLPITINGSQTQINQSNRITSQKNINKSLQTTITTEKNKKTQTEVKPSIVNNLIKNNSYEKSRIAHQNKANEKKEVSSMEQWKNVILSIAGEDMLNEIENRSKDFSSLNNQLNKSQKKHSSVFINDDIENIIRSIPVIDAPIDISFPLVDKANINRKNKEIRSTFDTDVLNFKSQDEKSLSSIMDLINDIKNPVSVTNVKSLQLDDGSIKENDPLQISQPIVNNTISSIKLMEDGENLVRSIDRDIDKKYDDKKSKEILNEDTNDVVKHIMDYYENLNTKIIESVNYDEVKEKSNIEENLNDSSISTKITEKDNNERLKDSQIEENKNNNVNYIKANKVLLDCNTIYRRAKVETFVPVDNDNILNSDKEKTNQLIEQMHSIIDVDSNKDKLNEGNENDIKNDKFLTQLLEDDKNPTSLFDKSIIRSNNAENVTLLLSKSESDATELLSYNESENSVPNMKEADKFTSNNKIINENMMVDIENNDNNDNTNNDNSQIEINTTVVYNSQPQIISSFIEKEDLNCLDDLIKKYYNILGHNNPDEVDKIKILMGDFDKGSKYLTDPSAIQKYITEDIYFISLLFMLTFKSTPSLIQLENKFDKKEGLKVNECENSTIRRMQENLFKLAPQFAIELAKLTSENETNIEELINRKNDFDNDIYQQYELIQKSNVTINTLWSSIIASIVGTFIFLQQDDTSGDSEYKTILDDSLTQLYNLLINIIERFVYIIPNWKKLYETNANQAKPLIRFLIVLRILPSILEYIREKVQIHNEKDFDLIEKIDTINSILSNFDK